MKDDVESPERSARGLVRGAVTNVLLPLLVLAGAGYLGHTLYADEEPPSKRDRAEQGVPVETLAVERRPHRLEVRASGTVVPARQLDVQPQVSGRVTWLLDALDPGTFVEEGEALFRIEEGDYRRAVGELKAAVSEARAQLALEEGQHEAAQWEWDQYRDRLDAAEEPPALALREPQLAAVRARLAAARARLDQAKADLERTTFVAPFNAVVVESEAEIGQLVGPQTRIARLVGTDTFRARVALRSEDLEHVSLPGIQGREGSAVTVTQRIGTREVTRRGRVLHLLSDLEPSSRMARLLVEVDDPYGLGEAEEVGARPFPLLLGAYVDVRLEAGEARELVEVPRSAIRRGAQAFVFEPRQGRLDIRELSIAWRRPDTVLVSEGLADGERIVVSPLATPVDGMRLREVGGGAAEDAEAKEEAEEAAAKLGAARE